MGVAFGSPVSSPNSNAAWISKNASDTAVGAYTLANLLLASGPSITNIQALMNANRIATGADETDFTVAVTYGAPTNTIADGSSHKSALIALANKFDPSTGHGHSGSAGDGGPIQSSSLAGTPLRGYIFQGVDIVGATGGSSNVSAALAGTPVSSGTTVPGAVVTAPDNRVVVRNSANDDQYVDITGNQVYARLTNSGGPSGTWTLTYFSEIAGVETAYSFVSPSGVRYYYQQLFNPLLNPPIYSEFASIPSDNATADVIVASSSLYGKVILATATPAAVTATPSAGTANATVANADHSHAGLHSISKSGSAQILGDATLTPGTGISMVQAGNDIQISASDTWAKYTVPFGSFSVAALTDTITLFSLPAKTMIKKVVTKHSQAFSGGTISAYSIAVGLAGNPSKYSTDFDVFQAAGSNVFQEATDDSIEDFSSSTSVKITATSVGDTLDQAAAGSVDVWVLTSQLP